MRTRLVIFDLDGTLLNTIGDLAVACNTVLALRGLPQHSYEDYCGFVGCGVMRLVERALPEPLRTEHTVASMRADFVKYYTENIDLRTKLYPGIEALVARLRDEGVLVAVASNKFQVGVERLIDRFFPDVEFAAVLGQREGVALKPDPAIARQILEITDINAADAVWVGDSAIDVQTATAVGMRSVGVTWGFRNRAELEQAQASYIVDHADQIFDLL